MRALAGTKETHAAHQRSVGHSGGGKNYFLAGREIVRVISLLRIGYAHRLKPLDDLFGRRYLAFVHSQPVGIQNQTRLNLAIQTFDRRRGQHTLGRAANAYTRANVSPPDRCGDSRRQIPVRSQPDARTRRAHALASPPTSLTI